MTVILKPIMFSKSTDFFTVSNSTFFIYTKDLVSIVLNQVLSSRGDSFSKPRDPLLGHTSAVLFMDIVPFCKIV